MRHAVFIPTFDEFLDPRLVVDVAVAAEEAGWDGLFLWDHVLRWPGHAGPVGDTWTTLAAVAARTSRIRIGPQVTIAGVATFGTFSSSPTRRENTLYQAVSNLSHRAGAHALRAGVDFLLNEDTITFLRAFRGSYTFSSMAGFMVVAVLLGWLTARVVEMPMLALRNRLYARRTSTAGWLEGRGEHEAMSEKE